MPRSRESSTSHDDTEVNGNGSDSDTTSTASHSSRSSSTSSVGSSSGSSSVSSSNSTALSSSSSSNASGKAREVPAKGGCDALAVESMERQQRLRRLISQRKVGDTTAIDDGKNVDPFTFRKGALDADDGLLLSTFSNALLFARLLASLRNREDPARTQSFDDFLSASNPMFCRNFKLPLEDAALETLRDTVPCQHECAELERSNIVVRRKKRERVMLGAAATNTMVTNNNNDPNALQQRSSDNTVSNARGGSSMSGIIAKSLQSWEQHLSSELKAEGVSLESFRQQRHDSSYLEEMRFLQNSQWADYQRELQLEEKRKEQEAKRAIRRGEGDMV
ncbi:uncharacterized protein TM35_000272270 [Trypanosoma theileri]|uniref:Uncharacterized protein n=1 Tax=Trypanosoma theileri TaxID=67003 RepID=A0A1X0NPM5_9TRYP|nr:uncharacterized protein TM35_000272270 [Trypanosoma theileri]ORC86637.1 hypothetical protein TM35_000272270 [Trypanosoma theileri]